MTDNAPADHAPFAKPFTDKLRMDAAALRRAVNSFRERAGDVPALAREDLEAAFSEQPGLDRTSLVAGYQHGMHMAHAMALKAAEKSISSTFRSFANTMAALSSPGAPLDHHAVIQVCNVMTAAASAALKMQYEMAGCYHVLAIGGPKITEADQAFMMKEFAASDNDIIDMVGMLITQAARQVGVADLVPEATTSARSHDNDDTNTGSVH